MPVKRLIILANSIKKGGRCVAGREVIERKGKISLGDWIRPVSHQGEGELSLSHIRFQNGKLPAIFDIVEVPLEAAEVSSSQPENWYIDAEEYWIKVEGYEDDFPSLDVDTPPDLWIDPDGRDDRISPDALAQLDRGQSLYWISVSRFQIRADWNPWSNRHKRRALFQYNGRNYDLGLTDPEMDKHCLPSPASGTSKTFDLDTGDKKILCVSLAPEFEGYHYKIVATVVEPQ